MPLDGLLHFGKTKRKLDNPDRKQLRRLLRKSPMDGRNPVGSNDEQRDGVETVGRHIDATSDFLLPEERPTQAIARRRASASPHGTPREARRVSLLPRQLSPAPDDGAELLFEDDLERMLP